MKCCDITAGKLQEPVTFDRLVRVSTGKGGATEIWAPLHSCRAWVRPMSGREFMAHDRMNATTATTIVVRYFSVAGPEDINGGDVDDVPDGDIDGGDVDDVSDEDIDGGPGYDAPSGEPFAGDRVTIRGRVYNVRYVRNLEFENKWFEVTLEGGVAA